MLLGVVGALVLTISAQAEQQTTSHVGALARLVPQLPEESVSRRWRIAADDTQNFFITTGTALTNLVCGRLDDRIWCEVHSIHSGSSDFTLIDYLVPARSHDGTVPTRLDDSARRIRAGDYDERGTVPCAQERGQKLGECEVIVVRSGRGDATVIATFSNGFARTLKFINGAFISANPTMSGVGTDTDWSIQDSMYVIRVDDQRYMLPVNFIFGN